MAERRGIRWSDAALAAALLALCAIELTLRSDARHAPGYLVLIVLGVAPVLFWRAHPLAATWAEVVVIAAVAAMGYSGGPSAPVAIVLAIALLSYSCGALVPARTAVPALVALVVAIQLATGLTDFPNLEILFFTFGPWWAGQEVHRRRALVRALARRVSELEAEESEFARLSVQRERARIARELHDIVSHHLAVMVIQASAGRMAVATDPERMAERRASIRQSGGEALADMDRLVEMLGADAGAPRPAGELAPLLERARRAAPEVCVIPLPAGARLDPEIEDVACRVVQEGLTNAMKHAAGSEIVIRFVLGDELLVEVRNTEGTEEGGALVATGSGIGLAGMRDRVRALGGSVSAGPEGAGGWCLRAHLPTANRSQPQMSGS